RCWFPWCRRCGRSSKPQRPAGSSSYRVSRSRGPRHPRPKSARGKEHETGNRLAFNGSMRIAQISPLYERVPPMLYGGTERVVSHLVEELVRRGNDVTLFASGDSRTSAELVSPIARALRLDNDISDPLAPHVVLLSEVFARAEEFDLIHSHVDYLAF